MHICAQRIRWQGIGVRRRRKNSHVGSAEAERKKVEETLDNQAEGLRDQSARLCWKEHTSVPYEPNDQTYEPRQTIWASSVSTQTGRGEEARRDKGRWKRRGEEAEYRDFANKHTLTIDHEGSTIWLSDNVGAHISKLHASAASARRAWVCVHRHGQGTRNSQSSR